MSVCLGKSPASPEQMVSTELILEHNTVLTNTVGTSAPPSTPETISSTFTSASCDAEQSKNVTKLIVTNNTPTVVNNTTTVIPKLVSQPLITVLNSPGPLTVVKSICVTSGVPSAPQFTLVNSTPLTVTNATGKSSTITLLNAPVALVKAVPTVSSDGREVAVNAGNIVTSNSGADKPASIHNVFVKNTCAPDLVQEAKFTTQTIIPSTAISPPIKTVNGQKPTSGSSGKVKILSNVVMTPAGAGPSNILLNKASMQRYIPRQKVIGNGAAGLVTTPTTLATPTTKYINKPSLNNTVKSALPQMKLEKMIPQRPLYPTHKGQIKTLPPVNNYLQKGVPGIKTLPPHCKGMPGQVQRTNAGIRTIPPQRSSKPPNKPNYIGKHAVQAQKIKSSHGSNKIKTLKPPPPHPVATYHNRLPQNSAMNFNQALTAEIIQTLSHESGPSNSYGLSKNYELRPPSQYENPLPLSMENREVQPSITEEKLYQPSSGLNTLSSICHAIYLDHNYNATMPLDSPTRNSPPASSSPQINGIPGSSLYSPGSNSKRLRPSPNSTTNISPVVPTLSTTSLLPAVTAAHHLQEEDAASDVSCLSDRKADTEGEETDTAPEAEAVNNDDQFDHYGDYVTRCICGFLHDDGYMIECDHCKVWQHVRCVVRNKQVPDEYLCEVCDPTKTVDRQKARLLQQQWMRETQIAVEAKLRKEAKLNNQLKHKDALTESDSSDGEHIGKTRITAPGRRKDNQKHNTGNSRLRRDSGKDAVQKRPPKRKDRKVVKRKTKSQAKSQSDEDNTHDPWINSQLPQLRQWIDNYEEAVTNHYSPELRARISNIRINGAHSDLNTQMEPSVQKCRIHMQPLTGLKYLVSTAFLPSNTAVVELRGKYMLSTQHRNSGSGGSLTTRQHAQRPGPFLFFYRLHSKDNTEVCVDTRTYGNSARFVRRSCRPNAELRHCIEKGVLHLYIVTIAEVEKNVELTIKHESHDLAAVGTTHIACACGSPDNCLMNKTGINTVKRNGEKSDSTSVNHRKRRSRRTNSTSGDQEVPQRNREATPPPQPSPSIENPPVDIKQENVEEVKEEPKIEGEDVKTDDILVKEEIKEEPKKEEGIPSVVEEKDVKKETEEEPNPKEEEREDRSSTPPPPPPPPVSTRRSSHRSSDPDEKKELPPTKDEKKNKKLSREERKIEAYMKAFERMEKLQQRRQEHQAKQAHRRESEPGPGKDDEKAESKGKRRRRKGRARTASTNSQASRRNRLNSADSSYATSGDEQILSPNDNNSSRENLTSKENSRDAESGSPDKAVGLLLSLANGDSSSRMEANNKTPPHDIDSNSNSAHSSPETPLSSACLLVAAAVGPLEPGFKFPKTKKGLMNEWLNKTDIQSASAISPSCLTSHMHSGSEYDTNTGFYTPVKNLSAIPQSGPSGFCESQSTVQPRGSAKKRWLRQAISEDQCDSPNSRPESPPISEAVAAPPKKRRLPRESLENNNSPPTTPTNTTAPPLPEEEINKSNGSDEGRVEIVYSGTEGDSPTQVLESDAVLKERAVEMQQEFAASLRLPEPPKVDHLIGTRFLMDPRLRRDATLLTNSEHLVGTVEKTLSFLGYEDRKPESITPAKRKLSITEYRQRKKLNNNDKVLQEEIIIEENNLSQSPKSLRRRSNSSSSITSFASSDEDVRTSDLPDKAPAFNSEPTELELQRENVGLRLKKAFGLSVDEESRKPAINVESLLNCELPPVVKATPLLSSPTFPIPGSSEQPNKDNDVDETVEIEEEQNTTVEPPAELDVQGVEEEQNVEHDLKHPVLYYTPDDEETEHTNNTKESVCNAEEIDDAPPFDNPVYPSNTYGSLTSTIDDDTRYEGRNPSPPLELEIPVTNAGSYQMT